MTRQHATVAEDGLDGDAAASLSVALARLATLRRQLHGGDLGGPAALTPYLNDDDAGAVPSAWTEPAPAPPPADAAPRPMGQGDAHDDGLRGRFAPDDGPVAGVDAHGVAQALIASIPPGPPAEAGADEPAPGYGAHPGLLRLWPPPTPEPPKPAPKPAPALVAEADAGDAPGAVAGVAALLAMLADAPPAPTLQPAPPPPAVVDDEDEATCGAAAGALADLASLMALAQTQAAAPPPAAASSPEPEEDAPVAVGAFAIAFDPIAPAPLPAPPPAPTPDETPEPMLAPGAHAALAHWLWDVPAPLATPVVTRAFDPDSLIDDALANAFDLLLGARDPFEPVWAAPAAAFGPEGPAAMLAACEAHLWDIPRIVPCVETFLATPNHETAVKLTRVLRLRAQALEARAFAEGADFGLLLGADDGEGLWVSTAQALAADDAPHDDAGEDVRFPDWRVTDEGFVVVTAPAPTPRPPARAAPLITEDELDALFAHVDEARAHILDDLGETTWSEPYWSDVDAYLASENDAYATHLDDDGLHGPYDPAHDILDIEVRDHTPRTPATHFWMPGDPPDLAVTGEGDDLFIVGGGDDGAVVLVEDGASHAMRTGHAARIDEVVVSVSYDRWRGVDAMHWTRIAVLAGVAQVRVEQDAQDTRSAVMAGVFLGCGLDRDGVRLVRSGDDGELDFPVLRVGDAAPEAWPFTDLAAA
ncbi:MAG: hypothetical protein NW200_09655 [Hyphomonadaceae bacterium]|nr:hypothetical protein [Hyphomonadaceae bacterium]